MRGNSNHDTAGRLRCRRAAVLVVAAAALVGGPSAAQAATWWRNTTTTGLWSDATLWSNAASGGTTGAPANDTTTDAVVFSQTAVLGNTVVTLDAPTSITGITVANTGLTTLQSSDATVRTLSIGLSGITANAGSGGLTVGTAGSLVGVSIAADQSWTNNAASPITVAGDLTGLGDLTKAGTGTLAFSGASTHSGVFTISAGTVQLGNTGTSSASRVSMANTAGAMLQLTGSAATLRSISGGGASGGDVDLGSGMLTIAPQGGDNLTYAGVMSGSGGFIKDGSENIAFRFTRQQTYTGPTVVRQNWLALLTDNAIASSAYVESNGGILDISNRPQTIGGLTGTSGGVHSFTGSGGTGGSLTLNVASGTSYTYGGNIGSTLPGFSLMKTGLGTQILTASNSYTGGTTITGGTLQLNPGASVVGGIVNNATLTLNGNLPFTTANNISGTGGLVQSGSNAVTLTGTNTYSGTTTITGGFLAAGSTTGLSASSVVVTAGGVLDISQREVTIGGLSGTTNSVHSFPGTGGQGALTLAVASGTLDYGGQVGGAHPNLRLTKTGLGTQILSGSNNYSGNTAVNTGTLLVNGAIGSGTVTVASGAILGGAGTIGGPVAVLGGGILAPGTSPGTLTVNNSLTLADTSILEFELDPADFMVGGGVNDLITGVTALTLDGILNVSGAGDWTTVPNNSSWRLFNYSGVLTNNVLSLGSMPTPASGQSFEINTATLGQVNLVIVPEPTGALLVACGVAVLALRRRGRCAARG